MEYPVLIALAVGVGVILLVAIGIPILLSKFYRKVSQGQALIVSTTKEVDVTFTGRIVWPVIHRAEVMDISVKTIEIDRRAKDGLICADNIRADIKVTFFVRVNQVHEDVLKVAQSVGCARASDHTTLEELFGAKFSEALKSVGKQMEFEALYKERGVFKDEIVKVIGEDLNGYKLEDAAIDYLEQTPLTFMDPNNILDSVGITKITDLTKAQEIRTNDLSNDALKRIGKQDMETKMAMLEYARQEADAEAKQQREIASTIAHEAAETEEIRAKERLRQERAKLITERDLNIESTNKTREEDVAVQNKERVLAVEKEAVIKEREMQAIAREHDVEVRRYAKLNAIEAEKIEISKKIKERVAYDKAVAEEEEHIKDLRVLAEADRTKKAKIIDAEADAEQSLVKTIKAAQAQKEVAEYQAQEKLIGANADLDAADKTAKAMIRKAEGQQAEVAAEGLGLIRVKEAQATVIEMQGLAEAKVLREKMQAEAAGIEDQGMAKIHLKDAEVAIREKAGHVDAAVLKERMEAEAVGTEKQGMAEARVKEAGAAASEKEGLAEAKVLQENMLAQAVGTEKQGLARVTVQKEEADAVQKRGEADAISIEKKQLAEALGIREKLVAEATGLQEKAAAMHGLDDMGRQHEEYRIRLEQEKEIQLEAIGANVEAAKAHAALMGQAFKSASIDIVGGDGEFFDQFVRAVSLGRSVDGFMDNSKTAQAALAPYISGEASLPADVKEILTRSPVSSGDVRNLTIAAFLGKLLNGADESGQRKIAKLLESAKDLGIGDATLPTDKSDA